MFPSVLNASLMGKAQARGIVSFGCTQLRDFAADRHRTVDDTPYGGGEGMVLKADVLRAAWKSVVPEKTEGTRTILMSPQGRLFDQKMAESLGKYSKLVLICGHYEGLDERFIDECVDEEISIGDYVLTGGELPALVVAEGVTRLLPGVVGNERSISQDSLQEGLLKYPQYTRPRTWEGREIPEVLAGGNHKEIAAWRRAQMEERTARKRPDLWGKYLAARPPGKKPNA
jgi:tRNA (guanine37-N1)-methyltransferase